MRGGPGTTLQQSRVEGEGIVGAWVQGLALSLLSHVTLGRLSLVSSVVKPERVLLEHWNSVILTQRTY